MLTGDTLERLAHNSAIRDLSNVPDFLVKDTFVSEDHVLTCIEILVPTESLVVDTAWVREIEGLRNWHIKQESVKQLPNGRESSL